jgi:hypothetical protein
LEDLNMVRIASILTVLCLAGVAFGQKSLSPLQAPQPTQAPLRLEQPTKDQQPLRLSQVETPLSAPQVYTAPAYRTVAMPTTTYQTTYQTQLQPVTTLQAVSVPVTVPVTTLSQVSVPVSAVDSGAVALGGRCHGGLFHHRAKSKTVTIVKTSG